MKSNATRQTYGSTNTQGCPQDWQRSKLMVRPNCATAPLNQGIAPFRQQSFVPPGTDLRDQSGVDVLRCSPNHIAALVEQGLTEFVRGFDQNPPCLISIKGSLQ